MLLNPRRVPSNSLMWSADSRMFVGEMSEIGGFGRVYDDACDAGLTLVSSKYAAREIVFVVSHTERDADGDVQYWDLVSADFKPVGFTIRIYND